MLLRGNIARTSFQLRRQGVPLLCRFVSLSGGWVHLAGIRGADLQDLRQRGLLRQCLHQRHKTPPVYLVSGQIDAVGLLECAKNLGCIAVVVQRDLTGTGIGLRRLSTGSVVRTTAEKAHQGRKSIRQLRV